MNETQQQINHWLHTTKTQLQHLADPPTAHAHDTSRARHLLRQANTTPQYILSQWPRLEEWATLDDPAIVHELMHGGGNPFLLL